MIWRGTLILGKIAAQGALCALLLMNSAVRAQEPQMAVGASPILLLDQDALFKRSKFGQALRAELTAQAASVESDTRRLDAELEAEERSLTEKRAQMSPENFAPLAAAFDQKVQRLRAEREAAAAELRAREVAGRQKFFETAAKVIGDFMVEKGAVAIIDKGAVIVSLSSLDVTDAVIAKLDEVLGNGNIAAP